MKTRYLLLYIIFIFVMQQGCKNTLLKKMEIENPKLETFESIRNYLNSKKINHYSLYFFKDMNAFNTFEKSFKLEIPEAYFFNKQGYFVPYKKTIDECNANVDSFINELKNFENKQIDTTISINKISELIIDEKGKKLLNNTSKDSILVILSFAKYLGKVNDEHTFHWIELLEKIKYENNIPISIILLDADFMQSWGIKQKELPTIY